MTSLLTSLLLTTYLWLLIALERVADALAGVIRRTSNADPARTHQRRLVGSHGQATTEYALVLLAAALVALLVIAWASAGGGAARISRLFNRVIDAVIDRV